MFPTLALARLAPLHHAPAQRQDFSAVEIKTEKVTANIAVFFGAGGNIAVSHGPDGTVLIDDQFAPLTQKIEAAVKELGATPVKFLINTHFHGDHTGGNENFGRAGAIIVAHDNVRERLSKESKRGERVTPPSPPAALPVITYADGLQLHLNGESVRTLHVPHAHTDGDSIVIWKQSNVVHMGDTFFHQVTLPFIDVDSGGNALGLLEAVDKVLGLIDDKTVVIPGHGPVAKKSDLLSYRAMLAEVISAVEKERGAGRTLEQVLALKLAAKYDTRPDAFIKGDAFVTAIWKSLEARATGQKR
jgi:cyclase